jgi:glycosyltransferase involved in cell wall biosynthesis
MTKKLTVVIPVYNAEKTIRETLESLLKGAEGLRILVVNDGSTDGTRRVLAEYPVEVIDLDRNRGIAHARNRGLERVRTPYVAFTDSDCAVEEGWAGKIVREFERLREKDPAAAAMSGRVLPYRDRFADRFAAYVEHWEYQGGTEIEPRLKLTTANLIADTAALLKAGKFDETLTVDEDRELGLRLAEKGYGVYYNPAVSIYHHHFRTNLPRILAHQFYWGEKTGLINEWRYRKIRRLWFLPWIGNAAVYALLLPVLSVVLTARVAWKLYPHDRRVFRAIPGLLAAKFSYRLGVLKWLILNDLSKI